MGEEAGEEEEEEDTTEEKPEGRGGESDQLSGQEESTSTGAAASNRGVFSAISNAVQNTVSKRHPDTLGKTCLEIFDCCYLSQGSSGQCLCTIPSATFDPVLFLR